MEIKTTTPSYTAMRPLVSRFLVIFLPLGALLAGILLLVAHSERQNQLRVIQIEEQERLKVVQKGITSEFKGVLLDLQFLAEQPELQQFLDGAPGAQDHLCVDYQGFARMGPYDEIRFLDETGMEVICVNYNDGHPVVVPKGELQAKANRYYFQEAMRLGRGGLYISPLDLKVENDQIEQPLKPVIRFATPILDRQGRKRGIVVLSQLATEMLDDIRAGATHDSSFLLLNSDGYWLKGLRAEDEWGFMYPDRRDRTFARRFPQAWQELSANESGQVYNADGLFCFTTVDPFKEWALSGHTGVSSAPANPGSKPERWKLVSYLPSQALETRVGSSWTSHGWGLAGLESLLGAICFFLAVADLKRKRAVTMFRQLHRRHALVLNAVGEGIHVLDTNGRIIFENPASAKMLGWETDELIGRPAHPTIHHSKPGGAAYPQGECHIYAALRDGASRRIVDEVFWRKDGSSFPVEYISTPVRDDSGALIGAVVVFSDITERTRGMEELRRATEAADASSRAKGEFLANMSHEVRTPITAIVGFADMMLDPDQTLSDRFNGLQTIRRNAQHLLGVINDILDISKIEAGRMTVERIDCDLPALLLEVMSMLQPRALEKNLDMRLSLQTPIPRTIRTDPLRLRQVLVNVVGNAVKFTSAGRVDVSAAWEKDSAQLRFAVTDSGIGMTDQQMATLFKLFAQADGSTTRRFGGTGLGLTISKRLVELLGGDIAVVSKPNIGSTFTVSIDAGATAASGEMISSIEAVLLRPESNRSSVPATLPAIQGRILLAEDGVDNQRFLLAMLTKAGAEVVIAANGRIAVDLALRQRFDLVFMDMQMPEMDGYAAASLLRRRGCRAPIVALTAHAMSEDREKCLNAGCTDYLSKPVDRVTLIETAAKYLSAGQAASTSANLVSSRFSSDPVMKEVVAKFVVNLPQQVTLIRKLVDENDIAQLRRTVHQLKGAGGSYGFDQITNFAASVETRFKAGDAIGQVKAEIDALVSMIRSVEGYNPAAEEGSEQCKKCS